MRKAHALHNEDLCDHLLANGQYNDWVVTSAFYSALHFVYHQLFPLTIQGTIHPDFNAYYDSEIKNKRVNLSKHAATVDLGSKELSACYGAYKGLYDMCMYSRYNNYRTTPHKARVAKSNLDMIKRNCVKQ